jgi:hypothetical protein
LSKPNRTISASSPAGRAVLIIAVLGLVIFAWFSIRWQIGNMLGELTSVNQPGARQIAEAASAMAPGDPLPLWLLASKVKEDFSTENIESSVRLLEQMVRVSPYDFRWWIELGRGYEQAERPDDAEVALKRSVELAPEYTFPRWQLGNFYLRQGRTDDAFAELMKTTEKSSVYREQVFSLAWDYFDKDPARVESLAGHAPDMRASLAMFYAVRGAAADALRNWNQLPEEQKTADPQLPRIMAQGLYDKRNYRVAVEFARQAGIDPESAAEAVTNGGFEKFIGGPTETLFGWRVNRGDGKLDIMPDSGVKREGTRSLRLQFRGYDKMEFYNIFQIVAVQPSTNYRLTFWVRTENLRSGGPPLLQIVNANDDILITASQPFTVGTADWEQRTIDFTTPENCEGITIRTSRVFCGEGCPVVGTMWYDDMILTKR